MRILMLCADWGIPVGGNAGSSVHFRSLARAFADLGHEVRSVVTNGGGDAVLPVPVITVPHGTVWPRMRNGVERLRWRAVRPQPVAGKVVPQTDEASQDRVHANASAENPAGKPADKQKGSLLGRLYYERLPAVVHLAEELVWHRKRFAQTVRGVCEQWRPDFVYERYALCQTGGLRVAEALDIPLFLEVNSPLHDERCRRGLPLGFRALARRDEQRLWARADRVFCVSEALKTRIEPLRQRGGEVFVTPNGVDTTMFTLDRRAGALRRRLGLEGETLVGWLGALSPERGAEEFVSIMAGVLAQRNDVHAVLIGAGPMEAELKRRTAELGCAGRMHFTGGVAHEEVPSLLADLDIAAAPYPKLPNFYFSPMKLYEYMASGLPVVAGNMGQIEAVVEHGATGLLLPPQDQEAWVHEIVALCDDHERRAELGARARERALAFGSWQGNASLILEQAQGFCGRSA
ncbi:glycosyltransferase [Desulfovibrio mangrovi]|uniref:glycosyltransferase n=1 Tax=Desulfovibrio mangrovi TaxID=2976983 RepID=UPI002247A58C|nr:glycosyltransferase [Desulfovibrio mangrovi]UZP67557.1 glycosyltransferase [Desulfovibrio mangrovi]